MQTSLPPDFAPASFPHCHQHIQETTHLAYFSQSIRLHAANTPPRSLCIIVGSAFPCTVSTFRSSVVLQSMVPESWYHAIQVPSSTRNPETQIGPTLVEACNHATLGSHSRQLKLSNLPNQVTNLLGQVKTCRCCAVVRVVVELLANISGRAASARLPGR